MFSRRSVEGYYFMVPGFYFFFKPVGVPYADIYRRAEEAGVQLKVKFGPILESPRFIGRGWIGLQIEKPAQDLDSVIHLSGEYETFEYKGPYRTLGRACQNLMKERPGVKTCYFLYLDDPGKVAPENCRTLIHFR